MKKFEFKLKAVQKLKKVKEDEALRELAMAQKKCQLEIDKKINLQKELKESFQRIELLAQQSVRISQFQSEEDFILGTQQRVLQADQAILKANRLLQKAMKSYLIARRERRTLDHLHDQAQVEYKKRLGRLEQRELDDLMLMRARFKEGLF